MLFTLPSVGWHSSNSLYSYLKIHVAKKIICLDLQIGLQDRGYLLELLLTKLRYASEVNAEQPAGSANPVASLNNGLQIIGMSATMPNASDVAQWLGAELYETNFRPVPLTKYLKVGLL